MKKWTTKNSTEIYQLTGGRINSYLVCHLKGLVLIDSGILRYTKQLIKSFEKVRPGIKKIDFIFITHTHFDHCENVAFAKKHFDSQVIVHSSEAYDLISGQTQIPGGTWLLSKLIEKAGRKLISNKVKIPQVEPDIILHNTGTIFSTDELKIIHTPGHSTGSMSLIVDNEIALAGDTLFGVFPKKAFPPFADDVEELFESWEKLMNSGCRLFLPGHGRPVTIKTLEKEFDRQLKKRHFTSPEEY
jgi:glyoxylase-like metal-dependent hydrolase (beta-lactamase superfamily II)